MVTNDATSSCRIASGVANSTDGDDESIPKVQLRVIIFSSELYSNFKFLFYEIVFNTSYIKLNSQISLIHMPKIRIQSFTNIYSMRVLKMISLTSA